MRSLLPDRRHVNDQTLLQDAISAAHQALLDHLGREIGARLVAAAAYVLGRAPYERRGHVPHHVEQPCACPQCGAVQSQHFSRNGSDVDALIQRLGALGLSLRELQRELNTAIWGCWACAPCSSGCINCNP